MDSNLGHDFELFMRQRIYITHLWSSRYYTRMVLHTHVGGKSLFCQSSNCRHLQYFIINHLLSFPLHLEQSTDIFIIY